ncbi:hypothetical protein BP6252_12122 [Coleophoma cylindrospora]|uniref:Uncharacterized protein n=1 Tax=Coleophoma cylindrospora TaxID=1849047 RepID=A0A3D8QG27_9HELO|nr:hypothetical protein BP6252_12122 [Coleophoma cylindrospora]
MCVTATHTYGQCSCTVIMHSICWPHIAHTLKQVDDLPCWDHTHQVKIHRSQCRQAGCPESKKRHHGSAARKQRNPHAGEVSDPEEDLVVEHWEFEKESKWKARMEKERLAGVAREGANMLGDVAADVSELGQVLGGFDMDVDVQREDGPQAPVKEIEQSPTRPRNKKRIRGRGKVKAEREDAAFDPRYDEAVWASREEKFKNRGKRSRFEHGGDKMTAMEEGRYIKDEPELSPAIKTEGSNDDDRLMGAMQYLREYDGDEDIDTDIDTNAAASIHRGRPVSSSEFLGASIEPSIEGFGSGMAQSAASRRNSS